MQNLGGRGADVPEEGDVDFLVWGSVVELDFLERHVARLFFVGDVEETVATVGYCRIPLR